MSLKMICPNCGVENEPGAERCKACEASLVHPAEDDQAVADSNAEKDLPLQTPEEQDLPDLLHSLKQDGEITSDGQVSDEAEAGDEDGRELQHPDLSQDDEVPEWLQRIRDRAQKEADAAGEITQKLTAAQENLARSESENEHENFASWIQSLRGEEEVEESSDPSPDVQELDQEDKESQEETPEWLSRIRKVKGPPADESQDQESDPAEKKGDSLLQWLVALEEGREPIQPVTGEPQETGDIPESPESELAQGESGEAAETEEETQKIPVIDSHRKKTPVLDPTREEQLQANLFSSIVVDERAQRPLRKPQRKGLHWAVRLIASLILIGVISAALFGGWPGEQSGSGVSEEVEAMLSAARDLPEMASLLIVADYQAGFSEEVHLIARPILKEVLKPEMEISIVASQPSGALLSRQLLAELSGDMNLRITDLGYYPAPSLGAYTIAGSNTGKHPRPVSEAAFSGALDGVFILADSYESARFWVEQLSARKPDVPVFMLVTAQAGPLLAPYRESGQVKVLIAGIAEIDGIEGGPDLHLRAAYQTGTLLLAVVIVIGAILAGMPEKDGKKRGDHGIE